jgi:hypothetical protein
MRLKWVDQVCSERGRGQVHHPPEVQNISELTFCALLNSDGSRDVRFERRDAS